MILLGFPISIFVFYETSTCRHGCANMTWDLWRSEWQISSMISIGFLIPVLFSKILIGSPVWKWFSRNLADILIWKWFSQDCNRFSYFNIIFLLFCQVFLFRSLLSIILLGFLISIFAFYEMSMFHRNITFAWETYQNQKKQISFNFI